MYIKIVIFFAIWLLDQIVQAKYDFDTYQIILMDSSGTELLNTLLDQIVTGTKKDVEQLTVIELEYITDCIDEIENKHLQKLDKLHCRVTQIKVCSKPKFVRCYKHQRDAIKKAETSSKIKAYSIRDSFLKQVLRYSDEVMKLYEHIQGCEDGALKIINTCLKKSSDLDPWLLCIENATGTPGDIHSAKILFHNVFKVVAKLGNAIIQRAHIALTSFSVENHKELIKITKALNECSL